MTTANAEAEQSIIEDADGSEKLIELVKNELAVLTCFIS
jgi:hypothetical protein